MFLLFHLLITVTVCVPFTLPFAVTALMRPISVACFSMDNRSWLSVVEWQMEGNVVRKVLMNAFFDVFRKLYCSGKRRLEEKEKSETCFSLRKES